MKFIITTSPSARFILLVSLFVFGLQICSADDDIHKDNIVVILDASGSMQDKFSGDRTKSKMEAAKEALQEVLAKVPDDTQIGLLVFSGANVRNEWVYPAGAQGHSKIDRCHSITTTGRQHTIGKIYPNWGKSSP